MNVKNYLTEKTLRDLLYLDPDTGTFLHKPRNKKNSPDMSDRTIKAHNTRRAGKAAGVVKNRGYLVITINGTAYLAHRLVWLYVTGKWPEYVIDHVNGIKTDNRFKNLRDVTQAVNSRNRKLQKTNTSGHIGVIEIVTNKGTKYRAQAEQNIKGRRMMINLGIYDQKGDAIAIREIYNQSQLYNIRLS